MRGMKPSTSGPKPFRPFSNKNLLKKDAMSAGEGANHVKDRSLRQLHYDVNPSGPTKATCPLSL
jgi:hypothetical protein